MCFYMATFLGFAVTVSLLRSHKNLAEPRTSQGIFAPSGKPHHHHRVVVWSSLFAIPGHLVLFTRAPRRIIHSMEVAPGSPDPNPPISELSFQPPAAITDAIQQLSQIASSSSSGSGSATPSTLVQSPPYPSPYTPPTPMSSASTVYGGGQRQFAQTFTTQSQSSIYIGGGTGGQSSQQQQQPVQQTSHAGDLDLNSLMLAQLGYFQSPGNNFNPMAFTSPQPQHMHLPTPGGYNPSPIESFDHLFPLGPTPAAALGGGSTFGGSLSPAPSIGSQQSQLGMGTDPYDMSTWMSNPQAFR